MSLVDNRLGDNDTPILSLDNFAAYIGGFIFFVAFIAY